MSSSIHLNSANPVKSVNYVNSVNHVNSVSSVNNVNSVISVELPPSLMVFLCFVSDKIWSDLEGKFSISVNGVANVPK